MHNYKIDKSLDFLQKAVSNNSPLFKDIAFTFDNLIKTHQPMIDFIK